MGQSQSRQDSQEPQRTSSKSLQVEGQEIQVSNYMYYESEERHCFDMFCGESRNLAKQHNHKWRKDALSQLNNLDLAEWPKLLATTLKKVTHPKLDVRFQAEVFWLDTNFNKISDKEPLSQINFPSQYDTHLHDDTDSNTSIHEENFNVHQKAQSQQIGQAVKSMLETSDIIDDNLYEPKTPQPWKSKSTKQSIVEANNMAKSITYKSKVPDFSFSEEEEGNITTRRNSSPWKKQMESSQKYAEGYKSNLFINQVPLVNGMDGRSISNMSDLYMAIRKYKALTTLIEKHMSQEENIFYHLIHQFEDYFTRKYESTVDKIKEKQISTSECEEITSKATIDLQQFIIVIYEAVNQFYCLNNLTIGKMTGQESLFNRNNMINFITSLVFKPKIHDIIFILHAFQLEETENIYKENLRFCSSLQPQDFGVPEAYCLNEITYNKIKDLPFRESSQSERFKMIETSIEAAEEETEIAESMGQKSSLGKRSNLLQPLQISPRNEYQNDPNYVPYQKAIIAMQGLKNKESPIHKLKAIVKVAELINECINDFYKSYGSKIEESMSGDETLAIFMYILAKSKVEDTLAHCKIIEKFSTNNILTSVSGYYSITLEACVNYVSSLHVPENCTVEQFVNSLKNFMNSLNS